MKYILELFIILIIALTTSSCFDNSYDIQIDGAIQYTVEPGTDGFDICKWEYKTDGANSFVSEGIFDLAYNKLYNNNTGLYGYILRLGVKNLLSANETSKSDINNHVNAIHITQANINIFKQFNNSSPIITEKILIDSTIEPKSNALLSLRLFDEKSSWEYDIDGSGPSYGRDLLYTKLYDNASLELTTDSVIAEIELQGKTLGGEKILSNKYRFKINLCVDCLLCPINQGKQPEGTCTYPASLPDACTANEQDGATPFANCQQAQDDYLHCIMPKTTGK